MTTIYRKTRPDDILGNLSSTDQDTILAWCDDEPYRDVLKRIAAPPPEGFGLEVHYGTLRNFYLKNLPLRMAMKREDLLDDWEILAGQIKDNPVQYAPILRDLVQKQIFHLLCQPDLTNDQVHGILKVFLKCQNHDLAQQRLAFQKKLHNVKDDEDKEDALSLPDVLKWAKAAKAQQAAGQSAEPPAPSEAQEPPAQSAA
jgi:hypothetical protein